MVTTQFIISKLNELKTEDETSYLKYYTLSD